MLNAVWIAYARVRRDPFLIGVRPAIALGILDSEDFDRLV